jgi:UDP-N-acetylmuramoyl-tripeptide--D-alanyl-D-alanine ligase
LRGEKLEIATKLYGDYNFPNVMASVAVADHFGVNAEFIKRSLEQYEPANNRSQIKKTDRNKVIMDAYNANPTSMAQAVKSFKEAGFEEPCLILGDMFELGEASEEEHRKIVELILEKHFPCVYLVGQAFSKVSNEFPVFKTTEEALEYFKQHPVSQKTILLKGSRGMRLESLMPLL